MIVSLAEVLACIDCGAPAAPRMIEERLQSRV
jgi:hypothetical protein